MRRRALLLALGLWLAGACLWAELLDPVVAIEVRARIEERQLKYLADLISIEVGEPIDSRQVRRTVRNLHAAGLASEIEVFVERRIEGLVAIVALHPPQRVLSVRLDGDSGVKRSLLRKQLLVQAGDRLVEGNLLRSVYALQDLYRDLGYLEAEVLLGVESVGEAGFAIVFHLDPGPRSSVGRVEIRGAPDGIDVFEDPELLETREGRPFLRSRLREDRERLRRFFIARDYRKVVVHEPVESTSDDGLSIDVLFPVTAGPRFEIEILGASRQELERKGLLPFLGESRFDEALAIQAVSRVERHYQEKGHFGVAVDWQEDRGEDRTRLTMKISPGPVFSISQISLHGNEEFPDSVLQELMTTSVRSWVVPGSGRLVSQTLAADLENIRSYYRLQGFPDVRVGPADVREERDSLVVEIPIVEGIQQRVVSLAFPGLEATSAESMREILPLQPGGPFHGRLLEDSRAAIRTRYEQRGYAQAQVAVHQDWDDERRLVDLEFEIDEGWKSELERIVIRGNRKTRAEVVREVLALRPGDAVSSTGLLEAQRRLYGMGLFSRVALDLASTPDEPTRRDLLVELREAPPRRLTYGFGYNSDEGVGVLGGWTHANLFGRAHTLSAEARLTTSGNSRYRLLYRQPLLEELLQPLSYMVFRFDEDRPGYEVESFGTQIAASWIRRRLRWGARYEYRIVQPFNITVPISEIERELQESRISSTTFFMTFNDRDGAVDARSGSSTRFEVELAQPSFSATAEYLKIFAEQAFHLDLRSWGVAVLALRFGGIEPLGDLETNGESGEEPVLPTTSIPIVKRFFGGGRTTHRAYERDLLGIVGRTLNQDGEPTGGNGLFLINLDYRFPIAGSVEGLVFMDAGNVWADWRDLDAQYLRFGAGIGARYRSPIGPLRLEMGWKLDREPGEAGSAVFLSFGDPF